MGSLDPAKLLVVLVVALVVIGPERLPRAAQQLGRAWRELTRVREEVLNEVRSVIPNDLPSMPRPRKTVSGFLADLTLPPPPAAPGSAAEREASPPEAESALVRIPVVETSVSFDDPGLN